MSLRLKYENCINCGAVVKQSKCEYCGTEYNLSFNDYKPINLKKENLKNSFCYSGSYSCVTGYYVSGMF